MCARMTWPLSSSTENVVLGNTCLMLPYTSSGASLVSSGGFVLEARGFALRLRVAITSFPCILPANRPIGSRGNAVLGCRTHPGYPAPVLKHPRPAISSSTALAAGRVGSAPPARPSGRMPPHGAAPAGRGLGQWVRAASPYSETRLRIQINARGTPHHPATRSPRTAEANADATQRGPRDRESSRRLAPPRGPLRRKSPLRT